jgi:hypothetical protein
VAHIDGGWQVNFADGSARQEPGMLTHPLYQFAHRVGDPQLAGHALALREPVRSLAVPGSSLGRLAVALSDVDYWAAPVTGPAHLDQEYLPDTGLLVARQYPGSANGFFLAAKAGHNDESHNHNDVGTFIVAVDGRPVLIDVGVGEYTRATFGPDRYSIWTMRSDYHNLPGIDGAEQAPGRDYRAREVTATLTNDAAGLTLDLAGAYPAAAGVRRWIRTMRLDRAAGTVVIDDEWELDHQPDRLSLHLMAAGPVDTSVPGELLFSTASGDWLPVSYGGPFAPTVEEIPVAGPKLTSAWGERVYRVTLHAQRPPATGSHRLIVTGLAPS